MRTWDIAKLLVANCNSPEEVRQIITVLNDATAVNELCSMLSPFCSLPIDDPGAVATASESPRGTGQRAPVSSKLPLNNRFHRELAANYHAAAATELVSLFRLHGMSNKEVEKWITQNFNIDATVGKGSLQKYLTKILTNSDLGVTNRILGATRKLFEADMKATSDIQEIWEALDRQFGGAE